MHEAVKMLAPVRTVAPETTPVSLIEAKAHLRIDSSDSDTLITSLIEAATAHFDGWSGVLGRALITQTWRQDYSGFCRRLRLPLMPVASVSTVTYFDEAGETVTLPTSAYTLLQDALGPFVTLKPDQEWPSTYLRADAVSVTFVAGEATIPAPIKAAILLTIGHLFEHREAVGTNDMAVLPMAVDALTAPYRRIGI